MAPLTAAATLGDGTSRRVVATWTVDDATVVSVDEVGSLLARGPGVAIVRVVAEGQTASHVVRVVPDYNGRWAGRAQVACSGVKPCNELFGGRRFNGSTSLDFAFVQERDAVLATFEYSNKTISAHGTIQIDGGLVFDDVLLHQFPYPPDAPEIDRQFDWRLSLLADGSIGGQLVRTLTRGPYATRVDFRIESLSRVDAVGAS